MRRAVTRKAAGRISRSPKRAPRNRRKPNWRLLGWAFLMSAMIACGVSFTLQTPLLRIRTVSITGVKFADADAVKADTKYAIGRNLIIVRKGPAIDRIERISEVASVRMGRVFPNGMWVEVHERKPFAVLVAGSKYYLMQSDGRLFHELRDPQPGLPLVEVSDIGPVKVGQIQSCQDISFALEALKAANHEGVKVGKISIDHDSNICLNMDSNFYIKLGQPDHIANKISQVHRALDFRPSFADGAYFDVSGYPYQMAWKPKSPEQAAL